MGSCPHERHGESFCFTQRRHSVFVSIWFMFTYRPKTGGRVGWGPGVEKRSKNKARSRQRRQRQGCDRVIEWGGAYKWAFFTFFLSFLIESGRFFELDRKCHFPRNMKASSPHLTRAPSVSSKQRCCLPALVSTLTLRVVQREDQNLSAVVRHQWDLSLCQ